jgi:hypothetical protein
MAESRSRRESDHVIAPGADRGASPRLPRRCQHLEQNPIVNFYGVAPFLDEAVELFPTHEEAETVVQAWDRDEPEQVGVLRIEVIELGESLNK